MAVAVFLAHFTNETKNLGGKWKILYSIYQAFAFVFVHMKLSKRETDREAEKKERRKMTGERRKIDRLTKKETERRDEKPREMEDLDGRKR